MSEDDWGSWTPETWRQYRNYADQVWIELHFVEHPIFPPVEDWILTTRSGAAWDQDWLLSRIEELGHAPPRPADGDQGPVVGEPLYVMRIQDTKSSWGADGAALQVLMDVSTAVLAGAAWETVRKLGRDMARRLRERDEGRGVDSVQPLTEQEAIERVRWMIIKRYDVSSEELSVRSVDYRPNEGRAVVELADGRGGTYSCELVDEDGLISLARIRRSLPPTEGG